MSEDHLRFRLDGEVTIQTLSDAFAHFSQVLDALRESHNAEVRWVLAGLDYGSASATARAVPLDEEAEQRIPAMYDNYIDAAQRVQDGDADREFPLHRQMYELMALADESHPITIQTGGQQVVVNGSRSSLDALGSRTAAGGSDVARHSAGPRRDAVPTQEPQLQSLRTH